MRRIAIAQDTLKIIESGCYQTPDGTHIDISSDIRTCLQKTQPYTPEELSEIDREILSHPAQFSTTQFEVKNETTLTGAKRMAESGKYQKIGVLNFASAKNPGGGFLGGAQAQEESLARSSALYSSLLQCPKHYEFHRANRSLLYSDRIIYSPHCPVFKTDNGTLLKQPYFVDFITSPAPNAGAVARNQPKSVRDIPEALRDRGGKVLAIATHQGCDALVLGAWGCGVFRNDPAMVAQMFADYLLPNGQFWGRFKSVLFSVLDSTKKRRIFAEFDERFSGDRS
ncbi:MAG: TIGR02452 family protein [Cyanobacteriota bacterium]|nr:TIGR02452 family protein [Cyanobacteriota bacterium]